MSLDESWTFGIFASFDLEVDKVTSQNLTLNQVQTTPDQMQFFRSLILVGCNCLRHILRYKLILC